MVKINIHCNFNNNHITFENYWLDKLFFHNTTLVDNINVTESIRSYNGINFHIKWGNRIIPEQNSLNILPYGFNNVNEFVKVEQYPNTTWIPVVITGEKIFKFDKEPHLSSHLKLEDYSQFFKKHEIYSDNVNIKETLTYKNNFLLTNTYFGWMHKLNMRLMYEFNNIYRKLKFNKKIGYFIYRRTDFRYKLANYLNEIDDIFVSQYIDPNYKEFIPMENIHQNKLHSNNDFNDLLNTKFFITNNVYWSNLLDIYFRGLLESEMYLIDETYSEFENNFTIMNLSEKTYLPILAKIPFLSTHSYPLECISKILDVELHPFYSEIKKVQGNPKLISEFIKIFLSNYTTNLKLCNDYVTLIHNKYINIIKNENSLLDKIL